MTEAAAGQIHPHPWEDSRYGPACGLGEQSALEDRLTEREAVDDHVCADACG
jgi:hypothetical protein